MFSVLCEVCGQFKSYILPLSHSLSLCVCVSISYFQQPAALCCPPPPTTEDKVDTLQHAVAFQFLSVEKFAIQITMEYREIRVEVTPDTSQAADACKGILHKHWALWEKFSRSDSENVWE